MEKIYTVKQIAEYCDCSEATVWRWFRNGKLKYVTVGNKKMVTESSLTEFIKDGDSNGE